MKTAVFAAILIIIWAAFISVAKSFQPFDITRFGASTVLVVSVAIQRITGVQRWLSKPKDRRTSQVQGAAQAALFQVCQGRPVNDDLRELSVHVWEVPLWYRKLFPYKVRQLAKRLIRRSKLQWLLRWAIRPVFRRVAAAGFRAQTPSGVRFRSGVGLVGQCVSNNDSGKILKFRNTDPAYRRALNASSSEEGWRGNPPNITHNLDLADARKLASSYQQVIARVMQDEETGEAIGAVTISVRSPENRIPNLSGDRAARRYLLDLAILAGGYLR